MLNVTGRRFDQSAKQLIVGHTTVGKCHPGLAEGSWYSLKSTVPHIPVRTNILQRSLIHLSVYFCAFLVRIDLHCKILYILPIV